jgi:hypothetical protein
MCNSKKIGKLPLLRTDHAMGLHNVDDEYDGDHADPDDQWWWWWWWRRRKVTTSLFRGQKRHLIFEVGL